MAIPERHGVLRMEVPTGTTSEPTAMGAQFNSMMIGIEQVSGTVSGVQPQVSYDGGVVWYDLGASLPPAVPVVHFDNTVSLMRFVVAGTAGVAGIGIDFARWVG